jgi:hypothetical protein
MSNVLDDEKQHESAHSAVLGRTLSRIQEATGIRRETISGYLKAAGIAVRSRGVRANQNQDRQLSVGVSTDSGPPKPATRAELSTDWLRSPARVARPVRARASRIES